MRKTLGTLLFKTHCNTHEHFLALPVIAWYQQFKILYAAELFLLNLKSFFLSKDILNFSEVLFTEAELGTRVSKSRCPNNTTNVLHWLPRCLSLGWPHVKVLPNLLEEMDLSHFFICRELS